MDNNIYDLILDDDCSNDNNNNLIDNKISIDEFEKIDEEIIKPKKIKVWKTEKVKKVKEPKKSKELKIIKPGRPKIEVYSTEEKFDKISLNEKIFIEEYIRSGSVRKAYAITHPNATIQTCYTNGWLMLKKKHINDQIAIIQTENLKDLNITKESLIGDILRCREKCELDKQWLHHGKYTEMLIKMLGLNEPEKIEMTGKVISINLNLNDDE